MKIALEYPNKTLPNKVFEDSLNNLYEVLNDQSNIQAFKLQTNYLTDSYDGYVLIPYLFSTKEKIKIVKSKKPYFSISSELFKRKELGRVYVRVLVNGNVPSYGIWNYDSGKSTWESFDISYSFKKPEKDDILLISPTSLHADITYGETPDIWIPKILPKMDYPCFSKIIIKIHPKSKNNKTQNEYLKTIKESTKTISIPIEIFNNPKCKTLTEGPQYTHCHNYSSTASMEAALDGKYVTAWSQADFLWGFEQNLEERFKQISACMWKPIEMGRMWEDNKELFLNNVRVIIEPLNSQISSYLKSL